MTATPAPAIVRDNDWRSIDTPETFTPREGVSVVVAYYDASEALAITLAALERQTYPRELFEVVIVDDGSPTPLEAPEGPLAVRIVHQEDRGFGLARSRNTGLEAARHPIVLFLDCDMVPEADWISAHARWHHAVSDALTLGFRSHVDFDGISIDRVREHSGPLAGLFEGRTTERPDWIEYHMSRTADLTSADDDLFRVVTGGNLGVRKEFFTSVGGYDETFTQWGAEDTEFGYRAFTAGAVLIPERQAFCWHQGLGTTPDPGEAHSLEHQRAKIAHLIAHHGFRRALPGRSFTVPQYLVSVERGAASVQEVLETAEQVLANRVHDLVVWIEPRPSDPHDEWLRRQLEPDPRVRFGTWREALVSIPAAAFHVSVPAGARLREYAMTNLRAELGDAGVGRAVLSDGSEVSITRARAAARAARTGRPLDEICSAVTLDWRDLGVRGGKAGGRERLRPLRRLRDPDSQVGRVLRQVSRIRSPGQAWRFARWLAGAVRQRLTGRSGALPPAPTLTTTPAGTPVRRADYPLGAAIATRGTTAVGVLAASTRVVSGDEGDHIDVVVVDTPDLADAGSAVPVVVLAASDPMLSVPAFDPLTSNPIRWVRAHDGSVVAIGPLERLPAGATARRMVDAADAERLRFVHSVEDVAAFHPDVQHRAAALARLAASGVVVHVLDQQPELKAALGSELYDLMRSDEIRGADEHRRELLSVQMRRSALRDHSLRARARALIEGGGLTPPPLPSVSILLATNRPDHLDAALRAVGRQTYPDLEVVLALHGEGFSGSVEARAAELPHPTRVVRVAHELTLGDALNTAVSAAGGVLLTKFDDDDRYSAEHVWDLVLAHEYSEAALVAKAAEFVHLVRSERTIHRFVGRGETYTKTLAGGTMLISRHDLAEAGGWRRIPRSVDLGLIEDVERAGGSVYRTHGAGYVLVRHGTGHTWESDDAYFLDQAEEIREGLDLEFAGIE